MPLTGAASPLGIPNFGGADRPALDLSPGMLDVIASIDTLLQAAGLSTASKVRPAARAELSAAQSIANNTNVALSYGSTVYDTEGMWAAGQPTRLTCKIAGTYLIVANAMWTPAAGGASRQLVLEVNAATIIGRSIMPASSAFNQFCIAVSIWKLAVNDYVEAYAFQDSGAALNVLYDPHDSAFLSAVRL